MVTLATPPRRSQIRALLEDYGFDMDALPKATRHEVLTPLGLRSYGLRETLPDEHGIRRGPEIVEGDEFFSWTGFEVSEKDPAGTQQCLWDRLNAADGSPADVLGFIRKWGLSTGQVNSRSAGAGYWSVAEFQADARSLRSALATLVTTEAHELVNEETLFGLVHLVPDLDLGLLRDADEVFKRLGIEPGEEYEVPDYISIPIFQDIRLARWRSLRAAGAGIELQAGLLARVMNAKGGSTPAAFVWDSKGRRIDRVAQGVDAICWSHLAALFTSPQLDVFLCDVCGKPFDFASTTLDRRPRRGIRRFCSEACRLDAKREANRLAWQKNGRRWRKRKQETKEDGTQG